MSKTSALGPRGLGALMGNIEAEKSKKTTPGTLETDIVGGIAEVSIQELDPNPENPRKDFPEEYINELATSIKAIGIIQPITVRKFQGRYQIISGECRFRAAKQVGLKTIPAYIRVATDMETLEMAVTENIQRKDLNPIEIAINYKALMDGKNLTQERLSERLGKSRSAVANQLRLLKLPAEIQLALQKEEISIGHAKPLISLENDEKRVEVLHYILNDGWSVRQVEEYCKDISEIPETPEKYELSEKKTSSNSGKREEKNEELSQKLSTPVKCKFSKNGKGQIIIEFASDEEFHRIVSILK